MAELVLFDALQVTAPSLTISCRPALGFEP
jgi:hypothetical protein